MTDRKRKTTRAQQLAGITEATDAWKNLSEKYRSESKTMSMTDDLISYIDNLEDALKGTNLYEDELWDWVAGNPDRTVKNVMNQIEKLAQTLKKI